MNNTELENKLKEILKIEDYFDFALQLAEFEKEYKKSEFFKITKKPLADVVKEAREHYFFNLKNLGERVQGLINNLDLDRLTQIFDQITNVFGAENKDIMDAFESMKDLVENNLNK